MNKVFSILLWLAVAALGAVGFGVIALSRGETISAGWLVVAGICTYTVAYRFYSRYLAYTVFGLDDRRATPAERLSNGRDFVLTNKWVAAGHHFSAISGAGPGLLSMPALASASRTSGRWPIARNSSDKRFTIGSGVPAGAIIPYQMVTS